MGEQLPFIDLGLEHVSQLRAGHEHTCASGSLGISSRVVKCWGATSYTQVVPSDLVALGDQPLEMGVNLPLVDLGWDSANPVESVTSGGWHNCARSREGSVKCWGSSHVGQLGYGDLMPRIDLEQLGAQLREVELDGR